jgi:hypothetical protein
MKSREVLHFPVANAEQRANREAYAAWRKLHHRPSAWWTFVGYAFWFGLGMVVSAYLTWMAS